MEVRRRKPNLAVGGPPAGQACAPAPTARELEANGTPSPGPSGSRPTPAAEGERHGQHGPVAERSSSTRRAVRRRAAPLYACQQRRPGGLIRKLPGQQQRGTHYSPSGGRRPPAQIALHRVTFSTRRAGRRTLTQNSKPGALHCRVIAPSNDDSVHPALGTAPPGAPPPSSTFPTAGAGSLISAATAGLLFRPLGVRLLRAHSPTINGCGTAALRLGKRVLVAICRRGRRVLNRLLVEGCTGLLWFQFVTIAASPQ